MSLRPRNAAPTAAPLAPGWRQVSGEGRYIEPPGKALFSNAADVGAPLRTVAPSPYNDLRHLTPDEYEDHDGGPWNDTPNVRPNFQSVPNKWVVAPALGAAAPALAVFPRRLSNNISFAPDVHLSFSACWTPIIARFKELQLTDVDKKGNMPDKGQEQHWLVTFKGKTVNGITACVIRIRVNDPGDQIEGWALYLPDTDFVQSFIDFPPPPASQVGFDSSTAIVVNGLFQTVSGDDVKVIFSELDDSVERGRRIKRAQQAWRLFMADVKQRSAATMENINFIRKQVYYSYFQGRERNGARNLSPTACLTYTHSLPDLYPRARVRTQPTSGRSTPTWTPSERAPPRTTGGVGGRGEQRRRRAMEGRLARTGEGWACSVWRECSHVSRTE